MPSRTVGIYTNIWKDEFGGDAASPKGNLIHIYRKVVWSKSNPRPEQYMKMIFFERYPDGVFVNTGIEHDWQLRLAEAERVVLLYPDAIGLGFGGVERKIFAERRKQIMVLNGRKREFGYDSKTWRQLLTRRFLERTMLVEAALSFAFIFATPVLMFVDLIKGRR